MKMCLLTYEDAIFVRFGSKCLTTYFQITLYSMFVSIMAFSAKVSDPKIGGTYMTLLNTVANLGGVYCYIAILLQ